MNSKQRRKFDRKWKHVALIGYRSIEDDRLGGIDYLFKMDDWCRKRFGRNKYRFIDAPVWSFVFDCEENMMEFKIIWA